MSAKIAAIVIPLGYVSDEDFAKDCGFELADDTVTISRAQHEALMRFVNAPVIRKAANINTEVRNLLGDLRAAGIDPSEDKT